MADLLTLDTPFVAFAGRRRSGKDTFARLLVTRFLPRHGLYAFAARLRLAALMLWGVSAADLDANKDRPLDLAALPPEGLIRCPDGVLVWAVTAKVRVVRESFLLPDDLDWASATKLLRRLAEKARALAATVDPPLTGRLLLQWTGTEWGRELRESLWVDIALRQPRVVLTDCRYRNEAEAVVARGGSVYWIEGGLPPDGHDSEPTKERFEGLLAGEIDNTERIAPDAVDAVLTRKLRQCLHL